MGRLDRYVTATLAGSCIGALLFLQFLSMLIDLVAKGPDYFAAGGEAGRGGLAVLGSWLAFHAFFAPVLFVTVAPFATVIGVMFGIARLMAGNEVAPMLFIGRSLFRVLRPAAVLAIAMALAMVGVWQFVIPNLAEPLRERRAELQGKEHEFVLQQIIVRVPGQERRILTASAYEHAKLQLRDVYVLDRGVDPQDSGLIRAARAEWNPEQRVWELTDGFERRGEQMVPVQSLALGGLDPDLLVRSEKEARQVTELSYTDLAELQQMRPGRADYKVAFHQHITHPLANLILLLLAVPFAVTFERGSRIARIVAAVAICAAYFVLTLACQSLGQRGLDPLTAAWAPTILFGSFGIVLTSSIRT